MLRPRARRAATAAALVLALVAGCGGGGHHALVPAPSLVQPSSDPLTWSPAREQEYVTRAAAGLAHVLYAKSPGGIAAAVARTEAYRTQMQAAASTSGVDPDTLAAIVLLESAGRPDVVAGSDVSAAAGLTQIVAQTGRALLGMHIDLPASRKLSREIARARAQGQDALAARLASRRRSVDQRFDPAQALAATVRYLSLARAQFGRDDLAAESYHMGIGNLQTALRRYTGDGSTPVATLVHDRQLSYARLYFDSTPLLHASAWSWLSALGDDSATYLWRVQAARQVLSLARSNPQALAAQATLQTDAASAEEVLHPSGATPAFADPPALRDALASGALAALPVRPLASDGVAIDPAMGAAGSGLPGPPALYRALRPGALTLLGYLGAQVRLISHVSPLTVTTTAADAAHRAALVDDVSELGQSYSLHATGWAFDISRRYRAPAQAQALQYVLDRLTALNLIAWVREPTVIHVVVAGDAGAVLSR